MRIDSTHRPWALATLLLFLVASLIYIGTALRSASPPSGGSGLGLTYGVAGYGMMLYAALLGARKKIPTWRVGRAQTWMRGHLWLGLLSFPIILFHSGFAFRGPLAAVLMVLFFIVVLSGVAGAVIQHYLPAMMTSLVPLETIYEEIPHVRQQLRDEADQLVNSITGHLHSDKAPGSPERDVNTAGLGVTVLVEIEPEDKARFQQMYVDKLRPFLEDPDRASTEFANAEKSAALFQSLHKLFPAAVHPTLDDLASICEEERQLRRQRRIYAWLHSWLLVHVPASIALLVLGAIHAVMASRY